MLLPWQPIYRFDPPRTNPDLFDLARTVPSKRLLGNAAWLATRGLPRARATRKMRTCRYGADMTEQRRTIRAEVLLVLGVSLGYSAVYSIVDLVGKLTAHKALSAQTTTLNPSHASGRLWLDLAFQLVGIFFGVLPAVLALHLVRRNGGKDPMGFRTRRAGFDLGSGVVLAAAIGIPGLAFYVASKAIGINTTVIPEALPQVWWTV